MSLKKPIDSPTIWEPLTNIPKYSTAKSEIEHLTSFTLTFFSWMPEIDILTIKKLPPKLDEYIEGVIRWVIYFNTTFTLVDQPLNASKSDLPLSILAGDEMTRFLK